MTDHDDDGDDDDDDDDYDDDDDDDDDDGDGPNVHFKALLTVRSCSAVLAYLNSRIFGIWVRILHLLHFLLKELK